MLFFHMDDVSYIILKNWVNDILPFFLENKYKWKVICCIKNNIVVNVAWTRDLWLIKDTRLTIKLQDKNVIKWLTKYINLVHCLYE
jgi:hypothetical protein